MASSVEATRTRADVAMGRQMPPSALLDEFSTPPRALADRSLASLIEGQIIPRLMLAHGVASSLPFDTVGQVEEADVDTLVPLTLACEAGDVLAQVERVIARGLSIDAIMVELLAPTARRLGTLWEEDRCDFVEVTMGLWRLQEVVRELSTRFAPPFGTLANGERPRRALFVALPGDQHDFGATMVGEVFHRHGWDVETVPGADMTELLAEVGRHHYDLVGLTVSCDCNSARLPSAILAVRSVSRNPGVRVMVGGRVFVEDPALALRVGADGTAPDACQALIVAEALVDAMVGDVVAVS